MSGFNLGDMIFQFVMLAFLIGAITLFFAIVKRVRKKNAQLDRIEQMLVEQKKNER